MSGVNCVHIGCFFCVGQVWKGVDFCDCCFLGLSQIVHTRIIEGTSRVHNRVDSWLVSCLVDRVLSHCFFCVRQERKAINHCLGVGLSTSQFCRTSVVQCTSFCQFSLNSWYCLSCIDRIHIGRFFCVCQVWKGIDFCDCCFFRLIKWCCWVNQAVVVEGTGLCHNRFYRWDSGCLVNCFLEGCFFFSGQEWQSVNHCLSVGLSLSQFCCTLVIERTGFFLDLLNSWDVLCSFDLGNQGCLVFLCQIWQGIDFCDGLFLDSVQISWCLGIVELAGVCHKGIDTWLVCRSFNLVDEVFLLLVCQVRKGIDSLLRFFLRLC